MYIYTATTSFKHEYACRCTLQSLCCSSHLLWLPQVSKVSSVNLAEEREKGRNPLFHVYPELMVSLTHSHCCYLADTVAVAELFSS